MRFKKSLLNVITKNYSDSLLFLTNHKYILQGIFISFVLIFCIIIPYFCSYFSLYKDYIYFYNFVCYTSWVLLVYNFVYNRLHLEKSFASFLCFYLNILFITFMLWSILNVMNGLPNGIYLSDLTFVSGLRYLIWIIVVVVGSILFVRFKISPTPVIHNVYNNVTYPYLQMEVLKILRIYEETFFGNIFQMLVSKVSFSNLWKYVIFSLHFIFSYVVPFVQLLVLVNFTFFSGDLRFLFYLMPLFLFSWFFKNLWFYFIVFINDNSDSIRQVLTVTYKGLVDSKNGFVLIEPFLLEFQLVTPTNNSLYDNILLSEYKEIYISFGKINASLLRYNAVIRFLPYILLSMRFFCWCFIVFFVFFSPISSSSLLMPLPLAGFFPRIFFVPVRTYATESFAVKKAHQKALEALSKGSYKGGHPVTTDVDKKDSSDTVPFYNQPTHGVGSAEHPSKPLSSSSDLKGESRPQNAVYPPGKMRFPSDWLGPAVPNSKAYHQQPEVRANDAKNDSNYNETEKD